MSSEPARVLILGAAGMLGHTLLRVMAEDQRFEVYGSLRGSTPAILRDANAPWHLVEGIEATRDEDLDYLLQRLRPALVVNAIGVVKQVSDANDPLTAIPVNALLPHRVARSCALVDARFVQMSTDCVFSGRRGSYLESDAADADDMYGRSKLLGEVDAPHAVTLRTSIIGHEIGRAHGLVEWFLSQSAPVRGFRHAIFSGLPTVEMARLIRDVVFPNAGLRGIYHVSADPISKYDLLSLVAATYGKQIRIDPDDSVCIDRSLDSSRFREATGFQPPPWPELVRRMYEFHCTFPVRN
jgi:dTDP-4-dehydrorhamnose reductase